MPGHPRLSLHVRVQHHPSRAHLLSALLDALKPLPTEVITHASDPPSPWGGYKLCITDPPDCSHLLIVQDDVRPSTNFVEALGEIAQTNDTPVCLFISRLPRDTKPRVDAAMKMDRRYVTLSMRSFMPIVAVLWPRQKLIEFAEWTDANHGLPGQSEPRSDDAVAGRWKMVTKQTIVACVPSIIQHPDEEPSTIGRSRQWGKDRNRVAAFIADDAMAYDWSGD